MDIGMWVWLAWVCCVQEGNIDRPIECKQAIIAECFDLVWTTTGRVRLDLIGKPSEAFTQQWSIVGIVAQQSTAALRAEDLIPTRIKYLYSLQKVVLVLRKRIHDPRFILSVGKILFFKVQDE